DEKSPVGYVPGAGGNALDDVSCTEATAQKFIAHIDVYCVSRVQFNDQIGRSKGRNLARIQKRILAAFDVAQHETVPPAAERVLQIPVPTPTEHLDVSCPVKSRKLFQFSPSPRIDIKGEHSRFRQSLCEADSVIALSAAQVDNDARCSHDRFPN